jgi:hypothetical protein
MTTTLTTRNQNTQLVNKPQLNRADLADMDREVSDFGDREPLLPLEDVTIEGELLSCAFEDFYDSKGMKITLRCTASTNPKCQPGKIYSNIYFTQHPKFPKILLEKHAQFRREFLLAVSQEQDTPAFKPSVVLQDLMAETGELGIPVRITRVIQGYTRNGKPKVEDSFERTA